MTEITGKRTSAKVYCDNISDDLRLQITSICDNKISDKSSIAIMPNASIGRVAPSGLSMNINATRIIPNLIGSDIGCGIMCSIVRMKGAPDLNRLERTINNLIPYGNRVHANRVKDISFIRLIKSRPLMCASEINVNTCLNSICTLGGGDHYIELAESGGIYYLLVHSGSGLFGQQVTKYYNNLFARIAISKGFTFNNDLIYGEGISMLNYIKDANSLYYYAYCNRATISRTIIKSMGWSGDILLDKTHNYITTNVDGTLTIRKGAQSAHSGCKVIIPTNITDGTIIGSIDINDTSKYNSSAPSSSGRLYSKVEVNSKYNLSDYKAAMRGIYCSNISANNIDKSPMVYNGMPYILKSIPWITVEKVLKPIYIFKAT